MLWRSEGSSVVFERTTVRALGQDEGFLEERIAERPEMLGLESLGSGIRGPYRVVRQPTLQTPTGRYVLPDLVLLTASAHLVAVEVKLHDNPELVNRSVIAQVVEYASALSALGAEALIELLGDPLDGPLEQQVATWFPHVEAADFAQVLLSRVERGEVDLVVACDRAPQGLDQLGRALDRLQALAFRVCVVEVEPWVGDPARSQILFLQRTRLRTEVVARTLVDVRWHGGLERPLVSVTTTSGEELERAMADKEDGTRPRRWGAEEIRRFLRESEEVEDEHRELLEGLLDFALREGEGGEVTARATARPTFSFRVRGRLADGRAVTRVAWSYNPPQPFLWIQDRGLRSLLAPRHHEELLERIHAVFGKDLGGGEDLLAIPLARIAECPEELLELSRAVKRSASRAADADRPLLDGPSDRPR